MHDWGDESVDWEGISGAARYIATFLVRWGRVSVRDYKEKWGTVRVYLSFGWEGPVTIWRPCHVRYRGPKWIWKLHCSKTSRFVFDRLNRVVVPYHVWMYKLAYRRAVQKWPHLQKEIESGADYRELLRRKEKKNV